MDLALLEFVALLSRTLRVLRSGSHREHCFVGQTKGAQFLLAAETIFRDKDPNTKVLWLLHKVKFYSQLKV